MLFEIHASSNWTDALRSWNQYGQISYPHWPWHLLENGAWAIGSTYHTVLKASQGAAIFGRDMLFVILFVADWYKIEDHRQSLTDCGNQVQKIDALTTFTKVKKKH